MAANLLNQVDGGKGGPDHDGELPPSSPASPITGPDHDGVLPSATSSVAMSPDSPVFGMDTPSSSASMPTPSLSKEKKKKPGFKRRLCMEETENQRMRREQAKLDARRRRRKRTLTKEVAHLQQPITTAHGCSQRVFIVVQNMDDGDTWYSGSPELVTNFVTNRPILPFSTSMTNQSLDHVDTDNFGIDPNNLPYVPESPERQYPIRQQQLSDINRAIVQQGSSQQPTDGVSGFTTKKRKH